MSHQLELLTENPSQWTAISYLAPEIQKKEIKPFVALSIKELQGKPDSRMSSLVNVDKFSAVREVVRHLARLRPATRVPWREDDVKLFLEGLRFNQDCITEFTNLLCTEQLYDNIPRHLRIKPGLAGVSWKIDLSLCQSNAQSTEDRQKTKELIHNHTYIILILELTDGRKVVQRLSMAKFHEFRFIIANALKSVIVLERRKCMRKD